MNLDRWNEALLEDVRDRGRPDQRLYLYVDRDLLARLSNLDAVDAVNDFCKAFQVAAGRQPFKRAADAATMWKVRGFPGEPSFVAHLAMTVLAVTEEPLGSAHGIYRRQNELLGLPAERIAPPGYGDDVPRLWAAWNLWLDGPGRVYGRSSARTHPHWTLQGWARSQGLIRHHDRLRIERFLEDLGLTKASTPSVSMFRQWLQYRGARGRDLLEKLADEAAQAVVQEVLEDEAARWRRDGARERPGGRTRGLLHYDDWTGTFSGAVEVDQAWHGLPVNVGEGEQFTPDSFDEFLLIDPAAPAVQILRDGVEHRLTDRLVVRFGGDDVYVMRDEPRVNGRLQSRAADAATNYHVLAHRSRMPDLSEALITAGIEIAARESTAEGWLWLDNLRLDSDSGLLRLLGLAALVPAAVERPTLEGGLPLTGTTYLAGGEPDLTLPAGQSSEVSVDGVPLSTELSQRRVSLANLYLDPGTHTVTSEHGSTTFQTVSFVKESATSGGVGRPVHLTGEAFRFDDPTRDPDTHMVLAGAAFSGIHVPAPLVLRRPDGAQCLVLTEAGELNEIWPQHPLWLRRIALEPAAIDVLDAVRTSASPAAFVIVRVGRHHRGLAIPTFSPRSPGYTPSRPRPDLVGELVADRWQWVGDPDEPRARRVLSQAMQQRHNERHPAHPRPPSRTVESRRDVLGGRLLDNPFDDVIAWLSEQESGRATTTRFAQTWAWLCWHYGRTEMAGDWRLALSTLSMLGHIERDFARQQVAAAPPALVALPSASGLYALCGARPVRLLERMDDPDDPDPAVAAAAERWTLHYRTPTDLRGTPIGPGTVYVEWDSSERDIVQAGLAQLGVSLYGCTATSLLRVHPSLQQSLQAGQQLLMSPGREVWHRCRAASGTWEWSRRETDTAAGFYRYRLTRGTVFAWRSAPSAVLTTVEPAVGYWLSLAAQGQTSLLVHLPVPRILLAPVDAPLPSLLARALALRTSLAPYRAHLQGHDLATSYRAYENVDGLTAAQVARLLQQHLKIDNSTLRMD